MTLKNIIFTSIAMLFTVSISAQLSKDSELHKTIKVKDSLLFEYAFESCNMEALSELISDNFEFYHDISGVLTSKLDFINTMKNGICNKSNNIRSRRQLDPNTLEIYPLKNNGEIYGLLEIGVHRFFETYNGKETPGSVAKFSQLWILENDRWKLTRVLSYNHKMPENK